jgi:pyruvate/2-oxoglutarate dehydrogenase complex dihydrolipoamide dehydrogenase (E3) component
VVRWWKRAGQETSAPAHGPAVAGSGRFLVSRQFLTHPLAVKRTSRRFDFDVAIIGGGSAGYAAARTAVGAGLKTVVIEGGRQVGGLCILRGCMPSKALLYAAEVFHLARHADTWGVRTKTVGYDFKKVMARKARLIGEFADYRHQQLRSGKFKFIRADARFVDARTVELTWERRRLAGEFQKSANDDTPATRRRSQESAAITAKHFIIATGSVVSPPPLPQLEKVGYITSDEALSLRRLPKSLIVLGGGAVAAELAQFFARFGVRLTMIQRSAHILRESDEDAARVIENVFRREGIKLFTGSRLLDARRKNGRKEVVFEHSGKSVRVSSEEILLALGRTANTQGLGLENAGVETDNARIVANATMQTSAPNIYAAGDCTGPHEIVHIAVQQGEIAAHNIVRPRRPRTIDYRLLTSVVFTDPQVATVGLTEKAAAARKIPYRAASYPFNDHGKSLIMEALDGFVKLLADPRTGQILGGCCVGPVGGELIHEITVAMAKHMTVRELAATPHYHPTLAEIWTYLAEELAERIPASRTE